LLARSRIVEPPGVLDYAGDPPQAGRVCSAGVEGELRKAEGYGVLTGEVARFVGEGHRVVRFVDSSGEHRVGRIRQPRPDKA
jgi:hypothetical protein